MIRSLALAALAVAIAGCGDKPKSSETDKPKSEFKNKPDGDGHDHGDHTSGTVMLEDATLPGGKKGHAGLTAHLSKSGTENELDLNFETFKKEPLTLPETTKVTAEVARKGDDVRHKLVFEPAPKDERKNDKPGECSLFVAKAPWMKAEDTLDVTLRIEGVKETVAWIEFSPKKFGHAEH